MTDFEEHLDVIARAKQNLVAAEQEISVGTDDFRRFLRQRQKDVIEGRYFDEDRFKDGVVVIYGDFLADNPDIVEDFRTLDQKLKNKNGQQVMIISRREERVQFITHTPHQTQIKTKLIVGEINGSDLIFNYHDRNCCIPTYRYADVSFVAGNRLDEKIETHVSDLEIASSTNRYYEDFNLGIDLRADVGNWEFPFLRQPQQPPRDRLPAIEVLVGNEEIDAWIALSDERRTREEEVIFLAILQEHLSKLENTLF